MTKKCSDRAQDRRKIKKKAVDYKGGKCESCGYDKCLAALTFHHLDPNKKDFGISDKAHKVGWDRMKKELDKCVMLCANCHHEFHDGCSALIQKFKSVA
jgi:hypothetical protein